MLTPEENERLTRVGPGTPMGELFRRYWLPALLSEELPEADGAPVRVRLLGEDLIAFRDSAGNVGLVDAFCPHRRAPMFFGRNEECGLRCVYHGWKFDRDGTCVDMPSEPPDSLFKTKVTIAAYPTWEGGGIVWTYMGPPELQPPPPDYELVRAPATHRYVSKTFEDCNWLQALEGGLDTAHSSFVHNNDIDDKSFLRNARHARRASRSRRPTTATRTRACARVGERAVGARLSLRDAGDADARPRHVDAGRPHRRACRRSTATSGFRSTTRRPWVYNLMYSYDPTIPLTPEYADEHETPPAAARTTCSRDFQLKRTAPTTT